MPSNLVSYKELKTQKNYIKLIYANIISRFGDSLDSIAFSWVMYEVTKSASMIALIFAVNQLPTIILQPFTGALVDRFSKKKVMILCDLGRAIITSLTAVLYLVGYLNSLALIIITVLNSVMESFRIPAGAGIVPVILDKDKYTLGLGLNQSLSRVSEIVGTMLAGGVIALFGSPFALVIDALTFVSSAILIGFIKCKEQFKDVKFGIAEYLQNIKEGFLTLKTNRILIYLGLLGACMNFALIPYTVFQTPYIVNEMKLGPEFLSFVGVALTAGMSLGAFFAPKLSAKIKAKKLLFISGGIFALFYISLWWIPQLSNKIICIVLLILVAFMCGWSSGLVSVIFSSAFTSNVDESMMARLTGILNAFLLSIMPIASFLCSVLVSYISISFIFLGCSVLLFFVFLAILNVKEFNRL